MSLLQKIHAFSSHVERASRWNLSTQLFAEVSADNTADAPKDYVYEFWCYMKLAASLIKGYTLKLFDPKGRSGYFRFPRKPGKKANFPYLEVRDRQTDECLAQLCAGTQIESVIKGSFNAPDISIQKPDASLTPQASDLIAIMDAKFSEKRAPITKGQFAYVATMIQEFNLMHPIVLPVNFSGLTDLEANCILTNGAPLKHDQQRHHYHNLRQIANFEEGKQHTRVG